MNLARPIPHEPLHNAAGAGQEANQGRRPARAAAHEQPASPGRRAGLASAPMNIVALSRFAGRNALALAGLPGCLHERAARTSARASAAIGEKKRHKELRGNNGALRQHRCAMTSLRLCAHY